LSFLEYSTSLRFQQNQTKMSSGYSCNDNQNYFVTQGRTTSRVLQNPGGKQSFSLFGAAPTESTPVKKRTTKIRQEFKSPSKTPIENKHNLAASSDNPLTFSKDSSSNSFASGANMNSGNVITGRSTSRVLNQPGGRTTLTLG